MERPSIPAELKRKILVEAGHRCAIPTCRATTTEIAHIEPWSKVKEHRYENLIVLCPNCHTRFDKGEIDKKSVLMYKDNLRYFIDKYSKFELDLIFELARLPQSNGLPYLSIHYLLVKSILDDGLVQIIETKGGVLMMGVKMSPDIIVITEKGRNFVSDFSKKDIGYAKE
jgi:hypothetical protein